MTGEDIHQCIVYGWSQAHRVAGECFANAEDPATIRKETLLPHASDDVARGVLDGRQLRSIKWDAHLFPGKGGRPI